MQSLHRRPGLAALVMLSLLSVACGSSTGPGGGGGGGGGNGPMTATIDGQSWTAESNTFQVTSDNTLPGYLILSGLQLNGTDYTTLSLYLGFISGPGTYPLGVNQGTTPGGGGGVIVKVGATLNIYAVDFTGDRGSVTITSLTATRIAGTFNFVAPPSLGSGAPGVKTVTNGSFDVALPNTSPTYAKFINAWSAITSPITSRRPPLPTSCPPPSTARTPRRPVPPRGAPRRS